MKKKKINIIAINEETKSHIIELHKAFSNNELLVMHGDRYREGHCQCQRHKPVREDRDTCDDFGRLDAVEQEARVEGEEARARLDLQAARGKVCLDQRPGSGNRLGPGRTGEVQCPRRGCLARRPRF